MKIYTKTGDKGSSSLLGGTRVDKNHIRLQAYGALDELNAQLGVVADLAIQHKVIVPELKTIQETIFTIGSHLASEKKSHPYLPAIQTDIIDHLEQWIDEKDASLPELKHFILPGGHLLVSHTHVARTVCRRAEREIVSCSKHEQIDALIVPYVNRLSDYFFILSRFFALKLGAEEIKWEPR
jgi:cob(I)alamin adenosyltransferase